MSSSYPRRETRGAVLLLLRRCVSADSLLPLSDCCRPTPLSAQWFIPCALLLKPL